MGGTEVRVTFRIYPILMSHFLSKSYFLSKIDLKIDWMIDRIDQLKEHFVGQNG